MSKLECHIVQDLLPSFADGLVNEKTANEITVHLSDCGNCRNLYSEMISGEKFEKKEAEKEIDYLKKVKSKNKKIVAGVFAAFLLMIIIAIGVYSFIGTEDEAYSVSNLYVTDKTVNAEVNLFSSANCITKVTAREAGGIVTISVKSSLFSFNKKDSAYFGFMADETISKVQTADGRVLWENGEVISQKINDIYNARVKYIGNNSAVSHLLSAIDIIGTLKCENYSIHLLTDQKPYGLEIYDIHSYDEMFSAFTEESYEQKIRSCAYIILACIENADFVQFEYTTPDGKEKTYRLTVDDANNGLGIVSHGESIKDWTDSHWELKLLIDSVGEQLMTSMQLKYVPYIIENKTIIDKINNNPIDKKYLDIQNNTPCFSVSDENENCIKWAEAYKKQYEIICKALLEYESSNTESHIKKQLAEDIENTQKLSKYNDVIADLFYNCATAANGVGTIRESTYCNIYLNETRTAALRLAEPAYLLGVDFEWIE